MPDITMCMGDNCPVKETCYRYTSHPSGRHQSYFASPPFDIIDGKFNYPRYWEANRIEKEPKLMIGTKTTHP